MRSATEGSSSSSAAKPERSYASVYDATLARIASLRAYPGTQKLSWHAASALVARGTEPVTSPDIAPSGIEGIPAAALDPSVASTRDPIMASTAVRFKHDPRLREPSPSYLSEEQVCFCSSYSAVPCLFMHFFVRRKEY